MKNWFVQLSYYNYSLALALIFLRKNNGAKGACKMLIVAIWMRLLAEV